MPFNIRRFRYDMPAGELLSANNEPLIKALAKRTADAIYPYLKHTKKAIIPVKNRLFDNVAGMHTDVWIDNPAHHALLYTDNAQGPTLPPPPPSASPSTVSKTRGFSGDVSGVIGETVFAWIMRQHYGMDERNLVHLRPIKSTGRYPDFEIHDPSKKFLADLPAGIALSNLFPFPCEVKAVTTPNKGEIKERLERAIEQLRSYWLFQGRSNYTGLISIALRNNSCRTYDIIFVWCL